MFLDRIGEIHVTEIHTNGSGDVYFPEWDRTSWTQSVIESAEPDEENEFGYTYSIWTKH